MILETVTNIPWVETIAGGGVLTMALMFLRYLEKKDKAANDVATGITKEFSQTVRDVSHDVKIGMNTMHEQTQTLLEDGREREAKLHELLRGRDDK